MSFGPVQILVIGFGDAEFKGTIRAELERLREHDVVRLIDLLVVRKDEDGTIERLQQSDLSQDEAMEFGRIIGALIGVGADGEEGAEAGAVLGAAAMEGGHVFEATDMWYVDGRHPAGQRSGDRPARPPLGNRIARRDPRSRRVPPGGRLGPPGRSDRDRRQERGRDGGELMSTFRPSITPRSVSPDARPTCRGEVDRHSWLDLAGILLFLVGFFNIIDGIAAISDAKVLSSHVLFANQHAWGWFFLIVGRRPDPRRLGRDEGCELGGDRPGWSPRSSMRSRSSPRPTPSRCGRSRSSPWTWLIIYGLARYAVAVDEQPNDDAALGIVLATAGMGLAAARLIARTPGLASYFERAAVRGREQVGTTAEQLVVVFEPEAERMLQQFLDSPEFDRALERVLTSPKVREALAVQTTTFAGELLSNLRTRLRALDRRCAGLASRGLAFAVDLTLAQVVFLIGSALVGLVAALVGGLRPAWLFEALAATGWFLVVGAYFAFFWTVAGQTARDAARAPSRHRPLRRAAAPAEVDRAVRRADRRDHPSVRRIAADPVRQTAARPAGLRRENVRRADVKRVVEFVVLALAVTAALAACGSNKESPAEAKQHLCASLDDFAASVVALQGVGLRLLRGRAEVFARRHPGGVGQGRRRREGRQDGEHGHHQVDVQRPEERGAKPTDRQAGHGGVAGCSRS
jgi:hypothetical protein